MIPGTQVAVSTSHGKEENKSIWETYELFANSVYDEGVVIDFPTIDLPNRSRVICFESDNPRAQRDIMISDIVHLNGPQPEGFVLYAGKSTYTFLELDNVIPQSLWKSAENRIFLPWYLDSSNSLSFSGNAERWEYEERLDEVLKKLGLPEDFMPTPGIPYNPYDTKYEAWTENWGDIIADYVVTTENIQWYESMLEEYGYEPERLKHGYPTFVEDVLL